MNPYSEPMSEDEKAQEARCNDLLQQERYWYYKAADACYDGKMSLYRLYCNRARYLYQLRVEHVLY